MITQPSPATAVDLTTCDREPIHVPGMIQPHGVLLVLDSPRGERVVQASANAAEFFAIDLDRVLGARLSELLPPGQAEPLLRALRRPTLEKNPQHLGTLKIPRPTDGVDGGVTSVYAIGHHIDGVPVIELELAGDSQPLEFRDLYPLVQTFIAQMQALEPVEEVCGLACREVRRLTGFDRALAYRFDGQWNGAVIAEDRNDRLPSYLGLRFPASDIPAQARALYRVNRLRLIAAADYQPSPVVPELNPQTQRPLDMSFCVLRSVSPVHLQYMRNMGTASSFSISILRDGELWGLIACHSAAPRRVPFEVRTACDLLAQVLSLQIGAREHAADSNRRIELKAIESRLLSAMAGEAVFAKGLARHGEDLLALTDATGAAVVHDHRVELIGRTPTEDRVEALCEWLASTSLDEVYSTDSLAEVYPPGEAFADAASGLLSISISELHPSFVLWFRAEEVQTLAWGGDPRKPVEPDAEELGPRRSFDTWKQTVRRRARPWSGPEVEAAASLRQAIIGIVLRRAEEMAELTHELEQSNKDLEAFSYSVSHDLRAPFRHIVGYSELLREHESEQLSERGRRYIATIIESAQYAGTLVDNLLSFSRMNRAQLTLGPVDMNKLVDEVRRSLLRDVGDRKIVWRIGDLPTVDADLWMIRLVVQNFLSNAVKYTRPREQACIEVTADAEPRRWVFAVKDNGVGFDMAYRDKLFGVFQRLHRMEDFEGTGIGLASARRIIAKHGGDTWAEGEVDRGATFYFSLPRETAEQRRG